ncbi:nucleotide pyrophosphohydrolase [Vagococcus sp. DIV0080]|uniref:Nucleotide pyrophosphohydrolase n=1 Tax=Candidatus Vagococcus giribetii TaxID=2230876 RepID=A0ABS3HU18_9ENTE|nr:nucleotide pyrophosphohydrolase [Vagococcus sp. DIV0080]MBO0476840.1 nucleotide pyrophosphohydrolase [Vagococcus sp. DIV0080]
MTSEYKTLTSIQQEIDDYINQYKVGYFGPLTQMARLTEELGELAREVTHHYGEKEKKSTEASASVEEELGDLVIAAIIMANSLNIDLSQVIETNMIKFRQRDKYRFERKDGMTND